MDELAGAMIGLVVDAGHVIQLDVETHLFSHLANGGLHWRLARFRVSSGEHPVERRICPAHEEDAPRWVGDDDHGTGCLPDPLHRALTPWWASRRPRAPS